MCLLCIRASRGFPCTLLNLISILRELVGLPGGALLSAHLTHQALGRAQATTGGPQSHRIADATPLLFS